MLVVRQGSCGIEVAAGATIPRSIIPVAARMSQHLQAATERRSTLVGAVSADLYKQVLCGVARIRARLMSVPASSQLSPAMGLSGAVSYSMMLTCLLSASASPMLLMATLLGAARTTLFAFFVQGQHRWQSLDSGEVEGSQEDADKPLHKLGPLLRWVRNAASSCDYSTVQAAQWKIAAMLWSEE